jgi:hypothetical protein
MPPGVLVVLPALSEAGAAAATGPSAPFGFAMRLPVRVLRGDLAAAAATVVVLLEELLLGADSNEPRGTVADRRFCFCLCAAAASSSAYLPVASKRRVGSIWDADGRLLSNSVSYFFFPIDIGSNLGSKSCVSEATGGHRKS